MNVVFIGPFGLRPKTTMSVRALSLARGLAGRGHTVTVLIPPWDDPERAGQAWEEEGVRVINVPLPRGALSRRPPLFHLCLTRALVARALALRPDVVHFFKPKAYAGLAHLALWWLRRLGGLSLRLVVDADDWEHAWNAVLPYSGAQKKLFAWQESWGLRHADAITVASRALERLAMRAREHARIVYVPNGYRPGPNAGERGEGSAIDSGAVRQKWRLGDAPTILLYSRFVEFRLERIVTLVKLVAAHVPQARWLIVGRGLQGEETRLAAMLAQAGLSEYVRFAGWLPLDQLPAHFQAADVAIYPYDDTLLNRTKCSIKLIDLLAAALPVVADAVGQNCEYIRSGVSGILVPAEDDVAFGAALVTLLRQPETRERLGRAAARTIHERFTWPGLSEVVERAYS